MHVATAGQQMTRHLATHVHVDGKANHVILALYVGGQHTTGQTMDTGTAPHCLGVAHAGTKAYLCRTISTITHTVFVKDAVTVPKRTEYVVVYKGHVIQTGAQVAKHVGHGGAIPTRTAHGY